MTSNLMHKNFRKLSILCLLFVQASFAQPRENLTFNFGAGEDGNWVAVSSDNLTDYSDTSRVTCFGNKSNIELTWAAESGDWVVYDKYSSIGIFFTRTIRFAASNHTIQVQKDNRNSPPIVRIGGADIEQYDYLVTEPKVNAQASDFPFPLPSCALVIFARN